MWSTATMRLVHTCIFSGCIGASLSAFFWMGRIRQMLEAFPLLNALWIPIVAFCVTSSTVYGVFVIHSWLPGVRWGRKYDETCSSLAIEIAQKGVFDRSGTPKLLKRVHMLDRELKEYGIDCPPILTNEAASSRLWENFLVIVGTCAKHSKLRQARNAFDEMIPENRREWERLNELLEEMHS